MFSTLGNGLYFVALFHLNLWTFSFVQHAVQEQHGTVIGWTKEL